MILTGLCAIGQQRHVQYTYSYTYSYSIGFVALMEVATSDALNSYVMGTPLLGVVNTNDN